MASGEDVPDLADQYARAYVLMKGSVGAGDFSFSRQQAIMEQEEKNDNFGCYDEDDDDYEGEQSKLLRATMSVSHNESGFEEKSGQEKSGQEKFSFKEQLTEKPEEILC